MYTTSTLARRHANAGIMATMNSTFHGRPMETPTFDYSTKPEPQMTGPQAADADVIESIDGQRVIESASASTAPQTNSSNFAYVLAAVTLGIISLLAIAFALLMFGVVGTAINSSYAYDELPSDGYVNGWKRFENEHRDELDQLEEELWNELMSENGYDA